MTSDKVYKQLMKAVFGKDITKAIDKYNKSHAALHAKLRSLDPEELEEWLNILPEWVVRGFSID